MNVTELARRLRVHPKELLRILPEYGIDVGAKAIKVDNKVAQQIMRMWPKIKRDMEHKRRKEAEENKKKEREMRKQSGLSVTLPSIISVREFAEKLDMPVSQIITELMKNGILANQNQDIDFDTAGVLAEDLGFTVSKELEEETNIEDELKQEKALEDALKVTDNSEKRAPVVVVMGHVDHGKTSLLDSIRGASIIDTEHGGITQHIGAYQTIWKDPKTKEERALSFIDTPGHEAFTVMRSRGAKVADIAILVVAADDGVKPQTEEVIQIIRAAKLPFVVAINKIDKEGADSQRVMNELSGRNIISEAWGGDVPMVEISAKEHLHIDKLLDVLLLVADMNEDIIKADPKLPAVGTIIESHVDKNRGPVATVLVQVGTLRRGDSLVLNGEIYGKVRAMNDYTGQPIDEAGPSVPAQIMGFKIAPNVGDVLDLRAVGDATKIDLKQKKTEQTGAQKHSALDLNLDTDDENKAKTLNIILRADVLGSLEAIIGSLDKIKHPEVGVKIIGKGLGHITEDDINKADAGHGFILGFNVKPSTSAEEIMREKGIGYEKFSIIYDLINWVNDKLEGMLDKEIIVTEHGKMKVKGIFLTEKNWMIVGGAVLEGKVLKGSKARVFRNGEEIGNGKITTTQIGQQDTKDIPQGSEGGIRLEGKIKLEAGDIIESYSEETRIRSLAESKTSKE